MISRSALFIFAFAGMTVLCQAAPNDLATLVPEAKIGRFTISNLYSDGNGQIVGARFRDRSGAPIYVLQIEAVPQVFMWVDTPTHSNSGIPHALEHLLASKGTKGRYLNLLKEMRLSQSAAATTDDFNFYSFSSGTGLPGFFEQFHAWLDALYKPDFTDLEAEREFYHLAVALNPATGKRRLIEQGPVYEEMLTGEGNDSYYFELNQRVFGPKNPFGANSSGSPAQMRSVKASDIRQFHKEHYKIGPTTGFIFALDPKENAIAFLGRISEEFEQFANGGIVGSLRTSAERPKYPIHPSANKEVALYQFPSDNGADGGEVRFAWMPVKAQSRVQVKMLQLFLAALADGDKSLLYKSFVDSRTRKLNSGATHVEASVFLQNSANFPAEFIGLSGLPSNKLTVEQVERLRSRLTEMVRDIANYPNNSKRLAGFNRLVNSYLRAWRRRELIWTKRTPRFGFSYDVEWKTYLEYLGADSSFVQTISDDATWSEVGRRVQSPNNLWVDIIRHFHLLDTPYATASVPSSLLLRKTERERQSRLAKKVARITVKFGMMDEQQALAKFESDEIIKSKEVQTIASQVQRPHFTDHPPLTPDDDIQYSQFRLGGVPVVATFFDRAPTIDLGLSFDLRDIPQKYYKYLPLLPRCFDSLGLRVGANITPYADLKAQLQTQLSDFSARYDFNPVSRRAELRIQVSATSDSEFRHALSLIQLVTTANYLDLANIDRLRDVLGEMRSETDIHDDGDNDTWFMNPFYAFRYQNDYVYLAVASRFTHAHWLDRLKWLLHEPVQSERVSELQVFVQSFLLSSALKSPQELARRLADDSTADGLKGELLEYWRRNISAFPANDLPTGLERLAREVEEDLGTGPARTIADLVDLQQLILDRNALRIDLTLSRASLQQLEPDLLSFLRSIPVKTGKLPERAKDFPLEGTPLLDRVRERYGLVGNSYPWHVGLVESRTDTANMFFDADFPGYARRDRQSLLRILSSNLISGSGPQTVYMESAERGMAYVSSISNDLRLNALRFYVQRTSDIPSLINLVKSVSAAIPHFHDPWLVDYALQGSFALPRSMATFTERGKGIAQDLQDGNNPEQIREFSRALLNLRREPNLLPELTRIAEETLCPVLVKEDCAKEQKSARSVFFFVGPERLLYGAESALRIPILRLYSSDFWLDFPHVEGRTSR